jgi:hypothetical protein
MAGFKEAFAAARKAQGPGKTFTYNGKTYSTNRADDVKQPKQPAATPVKPPAKISVKTLGPSGPQIAQDTMRVLGVKAPSGPSPAQKNASLASYQPSGQGFSNKKASSSDSYSSDATPGTHTTVMGDNFRKGGMVRKPVAKRKK